jgi:adenylosuccinate synthase
MNSWKVVIGANYGDEGKGLLVDYLANEALTEDLSVLNVRFNGGAQAGHTVVTPEGSRHVFSHIGAASFTGASTYLAKPFIVNPLVYCLERKSLQTKLTKLPHLFVDNACPVTTPFDVGFNQTIETKRGNLRHGSCGLGIGETIERHTAGTDFQLTVNDLINRKILLDKLDYIKQVWVPLRAKHLDIDAQELIQTADYNLTLWLAFVDEFLQHTSICNHDILKDYDFVLFEGAQGLALDQNLWSPSNPYVTRSNCGLANVVDLARWLQQPNISATYVSRSYITRHGRGPLPNEREMPTWVIDETNKPNNWQESLRYAPNTFVETFDRIQNDLSHFKESIVKITADLAITCLDELPSDVLFEHRLHTIFTQNSRYNSWGPTRLDVKEQSKWISW